MSEEEEGCYLVYDSDSSGKLTMHYSKTAVSNAVGYWKPGHGKKIAGFKFKTNSGRQELIRNCAAGAAGRQNYYSGYGQFIKAGYQAKASLRKIPNQSPLEVDVYFYDKGGTVVVLDDDELTDISEFDGVAVLPRHSDIYNGVSSIDSTLFLTKCDNVGWSSSLK